MESRIGSNLRFSQFVTAVLYDCLVKRSTDLESIPYFGCFPGLIRNGTCLAA
jgi:hypothetical protein